MNFLHKLQQRIDTTNSLLCIGLDPVIANIPKRFIEHNDPLFSFNTWIIDQTHRYVCAYKPNTAFYESYGDKGITQLKHTCDYIHTQYPDIPVIIDAKRGDIGYTNRKYAEFIFEYLHADAVTLHPYQGIQALQPFFDYQEQGCFILCKTSNPEGGTLQDLRCGTKPLWQHVAQQVYALWRKNTNCMLVFGATHPKQLQRVRSIVHNMTILVPGIGTQGGSIQKVLNYGLTEDNNGLIINVSRTIIYADNPDAQTKRLCRTIRNHRM